MYTPHQVEEGGIQRLKSLAKEVRGDILTAIYHADRSGHPAGSFSIVEAVVAAYNAPLDDGNPLVRVNPADPQDANRDIFVLGCGHNAPALYAVLARKGFFPIERLHEAYRTADGLSGHPKIDVPGIETDEGSLGQALPKGVGLAGILRRDYERGKRRDDNTVRRVVVLDGDGSFQEGSTLEAARSAGIRGLSNLVYTLNFNGYGLDGAVTQTQYREQLLANGFTVLGRELERWEDEASIGQRCADPSRLFLDGRADLYINGNDPEAVIRTFDYARHIIDGEHGAAPIAIILNTVKGHGHARMAGSNTFHAKVPGMTLADALGGIL